MLRWREGAISTWLDGTTIRPNWWCMGRPFIHVRQHCFAIPILGHDETQFIRCIDQAGPLHDTTMLENGREGQGGSDGPTCECPLAFHKSRSAIRCGTNAQLGARPLKMAGLLQTMGRLGRAAIAGKEVSRAETAAGPAGAAATLLVIQADAYDWEGIFSGCHLQDGRPIRVVQTGWDQLVVSADSPSMSARTPVLVHVKPPAGKMRGPGTIKPDFVLVRNEVRGGTHLEDNRGALYGLMFAGVPAVNSLESIYSFCERPIVQGELHKIQRRLGVDQFPVIAQSYFDSHRAMMYGGAFPAVVKVGHAHAGMGKMRVADHHHWEDVRSVVAMTDGKYCTAEPFYDGEYDLRIQKIGDHFRVFRRTSMSGDWKTNTGTSIVEEVEVTGRYRMWAEEASGMFGGLDICTVDVLHDRDTGQEYILEVNGTSSGLCPDQADEDNAHIRELTLSKMNAALCPDRST